MNATEPTLIRTEDVCIMPDLARDRGRLQGILSRAGCRWTAEDLAFVTEHLLLTASSQDRQLATVCHDLRVHAGAKSGLDPLDVLQDFYADWFERGCDHSCIRRYDPGRATTASPEEAFERWLLGAVHYFVLSWLKKTIPDPEPPRDASLQPATASDRRVLDADLLRAVEECLSEVRPRRALAFRLRHLWGLPRHECVRLLDLFCDEGCTPANEKQLVKRAREDVRKCLRAKGIEP
jgi:DNA-directed RNA polymerase specialized sigma24 family protein